jgi:hypothetical protein
MSLLFNHIKTHFSLKTKMGNDSFKLTLCAPDTNATLHSPPFSQAHLTQYNKFLRDIEFHIPFFQLLPTKSHLPKVTQYLKKFRPSAVIRYFNYYVNLFEDIGSLSRFEAEHLKTLINQCHTLLKSSTLKGDVY